MCVCVNGMSLKYAARWDIHISVRSVPCHFFASAITQAHTHMLKSFEDSEPMGLKVGIAGKGTGR